MKKQMFFLVAVLMVWAAKVLAFNVTTYAKVVAIDEVDTGYTRVDIDTPTSCGTTWFWVARNMTDYNVYMTRVLTALVADKQIVINERAPAWCTDGHLYNPRIGIR